MKTNNIFLLKRIGLVLMVLALFIGCKKDKDNNSSGSLAPPAPDAKISGTVHSPSGRPIGSAKILAGTYSTTSDKDGKFTLKLYHGVHELIIKTGGGTLFKTTLNININAGDSLTLTSSQSVLKQVGTLAYIPGSYDKIETIIIDSLGYAATAIAVTDLSNYSSISAYGALFFNCGLLQQTGAEMDSSKYANLSAYLQNHGSIYASDFAVECFTGDGNLRLAPPVVNHAKLTHATLSLNKTATCINPLLGGFIPDTSLCTTKTGNSGLVSQALINDAGIINLLGKNHIDINYDLGGWSVINALELPFYAIITDSLTNRPLAVKSNSFSNEYGGLIFYTTFHNHPQGLISPDVRKILQYFILNL